MNPFIFDLQKFAYTLETASLSQTDETISVSSNNSAVYGYGGNDTIFNDSYDLVTIDGGAGDDSISNGGYYNSSWYNGGSNVSISGGTGNDSIENGGKDIKNNFVTIEGGEDNDHIFNNSGEYLTINGGAGNDSIENYDNSEVISGGAGDDSIENNFGDSISIAGGSGNDSIHNYYGSNITIKISRLRAVPATIPLSIITEITLALLAARVMILSVLWELKIQ